MRVDKTRIGFFIAGEAWQVSKAIKKTAWHRNAQAVSFSSRVHACDF
ncbi:hypothetical protein OKW40_003336 [Paraburkholderia sp. RAU6.4a]